MKKTIGLICFATFLLAGCSVKELENPQNIAGDFPTFYASFDDAADETTKTYVDEKMTLRWTKGDSLSVFVGNTYNHKYKFDGETGANNGSFSAISNPEFIAAEPLDANYAVYPYNPSNEMSSDGSMSVILPSVQKYAQNSFGLEANTMVAATENKEDNFLQFKNLCGYVVVKLYGEGTVTSIKLEGNDGEKISGKADVQAAFGTLPSVTMSEEATTSITLDCGDGVTLGTTAETATEFWLCVPPVTFSKGFTVTATKADGWQMIKSTSSSKDVVRNTKNALAPIEAVFDQKPDNSAALAQEREALIAIYNALDGDNWTNNENWCSDKPVSEWAGVSCNSDGYVFRLDFTALSGTMRGFIPSEIGNLSHLTYLSLDLNSDREYPEEICNLKELEQIYLWSSSDNTKIGFPTGLYDCTNLKIIQIQGRGFDISLLPKIGQLQCLQQLGFYSVNTTGPLPENIGDLSALQSLYLRGFGELGELPRSIGNLQNLKYLCLGMMSGDLPKELGNLSNLEELLFYSEYPITSIPSEIYNIKTLKRLELSFTEFPYTIPDEIGNLTELEDLCINYDLTGIIPESIGKLTKLKYLSFSNPSPGVGESLSGNIPKSLQDLEYWPYFWADVIFGHPYLNTKNLNLPAMHIQAEDLDGEIINTHDIYSNNKLTIIYSWDEICPIVPELHSILKELYSKYHENGFEVIGYNGGWYEDHIIELANRFELPWRNFSGQHFPFKNGKPLAPGNITGLATVINSSGQVVYETLTGDNNGLKKYVEKEFNDEIQLYESTDYSLDGKVITLQTATKGDGIDIVLMGDAYSDRQIADGTYDADMKTLYSNLFTEEPYKSFKDHFNVCYVNVVSKNEGYGAYNETALSGFFGDGTLAGGNDNAVFNYAINAISKEEMDEALLIVAMNSNNYAGTCYMYYPTSATDTYGSGPSISYFPKGGSNETFAQLLHHETLGHGFAKLGDEYAYEDMGTISDQAISDTKQMEPYGWWKNVDFTSDPTQVKWSKFLSDERYANEGLGCFEGGLTYWSGVWRPTDYSIMRYNTGGFNAPSREAIWYRIHKLAYGEEWQYNYEDFVTYDAINRTPAAQAASRAKAARAAAARKGKPFQPLHEPVVVNRSWKDAVNNDGKNGR